MLADWRGGVVLRSVKRFGFIFPLISLLVAGCSSYTAMVQPGPDLTHYRELFVKENLDDNRGIAARIATSLREHGYKATSGPLTMLPPSADGIVDFQDQWSWDFTTHLVAMDIHLSDAHNSAPIAMSRFSGSTSTASLDDAIDNSVDKIDKMIKARIAQHDKAVAAAPKPKP
jgi:hypothetical protein